MESRAQSGPFRFQQSERNRRPEREYFSAMLWPTKIAANLRRIPARPVVLAANVLLLVAAVAVLLFASRPIDAQRTANDAGPRATRPSEPALPPAAVPCEPQAKETTPYNAGASGTPMTTCAFVERIRTEASRHGPKTGMFPLSVYSPATQKTYQLACFASEKYATCTGGVGAIIYLYNK